MNEILPESLHDIMTIAGLTGVGGFVFALFVKFMLRKIAEESAAKSKIDGENDIIEHMREELARLQNNNSELLAQVSSLQKEIITLREENMNLKTQISNLTIEVRGLKNENITRRTGTY